ncbi:glutathione S-transferase [Caerostris extrusa]|uniref:glutathione transferase n=1 Tax=Caerostris extrusa TaxID=172846 RepID=A0AAV4YDA7_CAEEX|nr:glutathione S-transferase [Caerostris extrusa]
MVKPVLGYWDLRGMCESIRYLLHYKNVDFVDKRYVFGQDEWWKNKFNLGLDFPNLPYYIDGDVKLTQSVAILRYLAGKYGMDGKTDQQKLRVFLAEQQSADFREKLRSVVVSDDYEKLKDGFIKNLPDAFNLWKDFLGDAILDDFPTLKAYHSRIKNLPELQDYFNSPTYRRWPLFGPMAKFGGGGDPPDHL